MPNCDDGPKSIEESYDVLKSAQSCGVNKIIFTSHFKHSYGSVQQHKLAYEQLLPYAQKLGIDVALGAEVHWKKISEMGFSNMKELTLGKSNLFLLEFSSANLPSAWETIVYKLQGEGLKIIIVHPERYRAVHEDFGIIDKFIDADCMLMLSATSLDKSVFGQRTFKCAKKLIKKRLIDIIASDAHCTQNYEIFNKAITYAARFGYNTQDADEILEKAFY